MTEKELVASLKKIKEDHDKGKPFKITPYKKLTKKELAEMPTESLKITFYSPREFYKVKPYYQFVCDDETDESIWDAVEEYGINIDVEQGWTPNKAKINVINQKKLNDGYWEINATIHKGRDGGIYE